MGLIIHQGSPWWLSPDIWVTEAGNPSVIVANPIAGHNYNVVVRVWNPYNATWPGWSLYVCWAIPTPTPIPRPPTSQELSTPPFGSPISVAPLSNQTFTFNWTPSFQNGGHECLIAVAYGQDIGGPPSTLNGDGSDTAQGELSIAQHNLGVLPAGMMRPFHYPFRIYNVGGEEREFVVSARQAPLSEIAPFHRGLPGGQKLLEQPGKVEELSISGAAHPDHYETETGAGIASRMTLPPHSGRLLSLSGKLQKGNALVHVTQSFRGRVIGGLSVLVMAETK